MRTLEIATALGLLAIVISINAIILCYVLEKIRETLEKIAGKK